MEYYVRFMFKNELGYGIVDGNQIIVLNGKNEHDFVKTNESIDLAKVKLLAPCTPSKAVCVGLNYKDTLLELGKKFPDKPLLFIKPSTSILNPGESIIYWPMVKDLRYEAELAVVIGKEAHCISEKEASNYIWGFTIANDVTARDLQQEDVLWARSKSFDTFLPLGPWIAKGIDYRNLKIASYINKQQEQNGSTSDLIFDVDYLVSYISHVMTLLPGDLILTGTPGGYGKSINTGDTVEIEIEKIGKLTNTVSDYTGSWYLP